MISIFSVIRSLDLFSSQIGLHLNRSFFYKTSVGGFTSIVVVIAFLIFCWPRISSFYNKQEVNVLKDRVYDVNPRYASFGEDRFMFALQIKQPNRDFITNPFFNITARIGVYANNSTQNAQQSINIVLEPCARRHFEQIKSADFATLFDNVPFGYDSLCPVLGQKLFMEGTWSSTSFSFIQFKVKKCVTPNDPTSKWNPVCASQKEIDAYTASNGDQGINIYHTNNELNPDESKSFITSYISDKYRFTFIPNQMTLISGINFQDIRVYTDQSLLPYVNQQLDMILSQENNDYFQRTELYRSDGTYVQATFRLSPYFTQYYRSYKKVSQLIGELVGSFQIIIGLVAILLRRYNQYQFTLELADNLYQIEDNNIEFSSGKSDKDNIEIKKGEKATIGLNHQVGNTRQEHRPNQLFESDHIKNNKCKDLNNSNFISKGASVPPIKLSTNQNNSSPTPLQQIKLIQNIQNENHSPNKEYILQATSSNQFQLNGLSLKDMSLAHPSQTNEQQAKKLTFLEKAKKFISTSKRDQKISRSLDQVNSETKVEMQDIEMSNDNNKKASLVKRFAQLMMKRNQRLISKSSFKQLFEMFSCTKKIIKTDSNAISKASSLIYSDLNICTVLQQIQEINKMKSVLFDRNQLEIFNYHPKPKIDCSQESTQLQVLSLSEPKSKEIKKLESRKKQDQYSLDNNNCAAKDEIDSMKKYDHLFSSYLKLKQSLPMKNINSRLLFSLDKDLLHLFGKFEQIDNSTDTPLQLLKHPNRRSIQINQKQYQNIPMEENYLSRSIISPLNNSKIMDIKDQVNSPMKTFIKQPQLHLKSQMNQLDLSKQDIEFKGTSVASPMMLYSQSQLQKGFSSLDESNRIILAHDIINLEEKEGIPHEGSNYEIIIDNIQKYRSTINQN